MKVAGVCSCVYGLASRGATARCTTSITDCIIHGTSEEAQHKRELAGPMITLVIAYNHLDFIIWCETNHRSVDDPRVIFVKDVSALSGLSAPAEVVITGRGYLRADITRIRQAVHVIQSTNTNPAQPA
jgi:hypothetical protein